MASAQIIHCINEGAETEDRGTCTLVQPKLGEQGIFFAFDFRLDNDAL